MRKLLPLFFLIISGFVIYSCSDSMTGTDDSNQAGQEPRPFNSQTAPGDSAQSFLESDQYTTLNIEVDYMEGYKPTQGALDSLTVFLKKHLNKSEINVGVPNSIPAEGQNAYSVEDIAALEEEHRDHYTQAGSDTLWAHFMVVDGEYTEANVLGIAYYNTSMAFFGQTIQDNSRESGELGSQPTREKMEGTVFRHEVGHNLGLVNGGTPMVEDHQDSANGHHCTQEECLMYYAVRTTDYFANVFDGDIPDLHQYCNADLEANGGK